jgi:hypothetical protein
MWYSPLAFSLDKRDVMGGWLLCLVVVAMFFGLSASFDGAGRDGRAAMAAATPSASTPKLCLFRHAFRPVTPAKAGGRGSAPQGSTATPS